MELNKNSIYTSEHTYQQMKVPEKRENSTVGSRTSSGNEMTLDAAIESIPVGYFHYRLLFMCGAVFMADAMEVNLLTFMSQCAGAEWGLDNAQVAAITSAVFAGELFGGLFWGPVADTYGRRKGFMMAVAIIAIAGVFSGASVNYGMLIALRGICGFGIGGLTIPFDLLSEFMPPERRGEFLMKMEYFWTAGSIFVTGTAWVMLKSEGWRTVTYFTAIPVIVASLFSVSLLPESPRWLLEKGRIAEAEKVMREAGQVNSTPLPENFKLAPLRAMSTVDLDEKESPLVATLMAYKSLLEPENVRYSYQLWVLWFCFGLTYYGLILFVSRIYMKEDDETAKGGPSCDFEFENIFTNACSELVGIFLTLLIIDPWGRPKTLVLTYSLAAFGALLLGLLADGTGVLIVGLIGRAAVVSANSATWVATPELYKTDLRGTGHASCNAATRMGGFIAPFIVDSDVSFAGVGVVLAVFNGIGAITSTLSPDMRGLDIDLDIAPSELMGRFIFGGWPRQKYLEMSSLCWPSNARLAVASPAMESPTSSPSSSQPRQRTGSGMQSTLLQGQQTSLSPLQSSSISSSI